MDSEYIFECGCGERYRCADDAWDCRKCRRYLSDDDYFARNVVNIVTGQTFGDDSSEEIQ